MVAGIITSISFKAVTCLKIILGALSTERLGLTTNDMFRAIHGIYGHAKRGAGLARVLNSIGSAKDLMLITAFRSERTKAENEKDFRALPGVLRSFFKSTSLCAYWLGVTRRSAKAHSKVRK